MTRFRFGAGAVGGLAAKVGAALGCAAVGLSIAAAGAAADGGAPDYKLPDSTPPVATLRVPTQTLRHVVRSGTLVAVVTTSEAGSISGQAVVGRALSRRLRLPANGQPFSASAKPAVVATGTARPATPGTYRLTLKLTRKARRELRKIRQAAVALLVRVADRAGNRRLVIKKVTLYSAAASSADELWLTVNACDTAKLRLAMGVRASVPGNGSKQRRFVRFGAQAWNSARRQWAPVGGTPNSPWQDLGLANQQARQTGWTFRFEAPPPGDTFLVRGSAQVEWRNRNGHVIKRRRLITKSNVHGVDGGDPPGTSKAICAITNLGSS